MKGYLTNRGFIEYNATRAVGRKKLERSGRMGKQEALTTEQIEELVSSAVPPASQ
jgi:hypothetical protein